MSWSLGEARGLAVKAARGCGMPWGLAEEAGFTVEWLEAQTGPGVEALALLLTAMQEGGGWSSQYCPISLGASISDENSWAGKFPAILNQPLLITPFLSLVAEAESYELSWADLKVYGNTTGISGGMSAPVTQTGKFECRIRSGVVTSPSMHRLPRVADNREPHMQVLYKFAENTYAPATEASRLKGAGAGLNDND